MELRPRLTRTGAPQRRVMWARRRLVAIRLGREADAGANSLQGDMAEFLMYTGALSTTNLDLVGNYLATKYGLTWAAAV